MKIVLHQSFLAAAAVVSVASVANAQEHQKLYSTRGGVNAQKHRANWIPTKAKGVGPMPKESPHAAASTASRPSVESNKGPSPNGPSPEKLYPAFLSITDCKSNAVTVEKGLLCIEW